MGDTLTTGQAAKLCDVSFQTVLRWIQRGEVKSYKLPGRGDNRICVSDFVEFLERHQMPIPEELRPSGPRALVVDDDPVAAVIISETLAQHGFATAIAYNGFSAGAQLATFHPDLVTLDLQMPEISGHDVIQFIRSSELLKHIRILVVSAMEPMELRKAEIEGADDTLRKPVDPAALLKKVSQLVKLDGVKITG